MRSPEPCVQCGYCCTVAPCPFGEWNKEKGACEFLKEDMTCEKYWIINDIQKHTELKMFGTGCCSTFNLMRFEKLQETGRVAPGTTYHEYVSSILDRMNKSLEEQCPNRKQTIPEKS